MLGIRKATLLDLPMIVDVHIEAFPGFFLTLLGSSFLGELYSGFLDEESSICLVSIDGEDIVGFVFGTVRPEQFFGSRLRKRWYTFTRHAFGALVRRPFLVSRRLWSALWYRGEAPGAPYQGALLSSVGVSPKCARQGTGSLLVEKFCEVAASKGSRYVYLTTDRDNNEAVNRFYLRCGFLLKSSFLKYGTRHMNRYIRPTA